VLRVLRKKRETQREGVVCKGVEQVCRNESDWKEGGSTYGEHGGAKKETRREGNRGGGRSKNEIRAKLGARYTQAFWWGRGLGGVCLAARGTWGAGHQGGHVGKNKGGATVRKGRLRHVEGPFDHYNYFFEQLG